MKTYNYNFPPGLISFVALIIPSINSAISCLQRSLKLENVFVLTSIFLRDFFLDFPL